MAWLRPSDAVTVVFLQAKDYGSELPKSPYAAPLRTIDRGSGMRKKAPDCLRAPLRRPSIEAKW